MTAVSLFDTLGHEQSDAKLRTALAEKLAASALADFQRLREYEQLCVLTPDNHLPPSPSLLDSMRQLYAQWVDEADQVAARVRSLPNRGVGVPAADQLDDAIGRIRARLSVLPAQFASALQQAREGRFVPTKELRDELRARRLVSA